MGEMEEKRKQKNKEKLKENQTIHPYKFRQYISPISNNLSVVAYR